MAIYENSMIIEYTTTFYYNLNKKTFMWKQAEKKNSLNFTTVKYIYNCYIRRTISQFNVLLIIILLSSYNMDSHSFLIFHLHAFISYK